MSCFAITGILVFKVPKLVRMMFQTTSSWYESLRNAELDDDIDALGTDECSESEDVQQYCDVSQESALENVMPPSTLKIVENRAFEECNSLKTVTLPDQRGRNGDRCFFGSGITEFVVPKSVTKMGKCVFQECDSLKRVSFQAGSRREKIDISCF